MLVVDLCRDFYRPLLNQRVALLVNCDVDALCTCAILQQLFRTDHVLYTVVPIKQPDDLRKAFADNFPLMRHVILVNCGALCDIVEEFNPPDDVIIYIIDTIRPVDVNNIYSDGQIRIVSPLDAEDSVPSFSQLYRDDEDDTDLSAESDGRDDDDDEELISGSGERRTSVKRRRRYDGASLQRRDDRRRWHEKRRQLLNDYTQFTRHSGCSALLVYQLSVQLSRDSSRLLWLALVAQYSQLLVRRCSSQQYVLSAGRQQGHVARYAHRTDSSTSVDCLRLSFEPDLHLTLYRHWSLFDSLRYTPHVACQMRLFTYRGEKRLLEMLAELGLPLSQCRQRYLSMDMELRRQLRELLPSRADKYQLQQPLIGSFVAQRGYRPPLSAADVAHALLARLELEPSASGSESLDSVEKAVANGDDSSVDEHFLMALSCLEPRHEETQLARAMSHARLLCRLMHDTVRGMLDMQHVISIGAFLYAAVSEGESAGRLLARPLSAAMLAQFTLDAHVASERSRRSRHLPLVLSVPAGGVSAEATVSGGASCVLAGVPPVSEHAPRNLLGRAFQRAAERCSIQMTVHAFDGAVIEISVDERSKFLDTLAALLA